MLLQPIVEGYGDVAAVPVLLRRLAEEAGCHQLQVGRPIRQPASKLIKEDSLRRAVQLAKIQPGCAAILILFEHEDGCPKTLGPQLAQWAQAEAAPVPCAVALAHREYEAWFLASVESLRGKRGIREDAPPPPDPESVRGAKEALESLMPPDASYHETVDQPALSALFDMRAAHARSRSFRHLVKVFGELARQAGSVLTAWPPATWLSPGS
ncbi:MAG TPA: DUF4276 family protein [Candidatus Brocadiia bacterium]|nr:DUF4276 family protein [Candidatus Brocadiia bacterium]